MIVVIVVPVLSNFFIFRLKIEGSQKYNAPDLPKQAPHGLDILAVAIGPS